MRVLVTFCLSFFLFGVISADEEDDKKKEQIVSFYKCIACSPADVQAAYAKCEELKPEQIRMIGEKCFEQVVGFTHSTHSSEDCWKELCQNPDNIEKIIDCSSKDIEEFIKSSTEEDITAYKKFVDCAIGVNCSEYFTS